MPAGSSSSTPAIRLIYLIEIAGGGAARFRISSQNIERFWFHGWDLGLAQGEEGP
jgi:hypothetical protein